MGSFVTVHREGLAMLQPLSTGSEAASGSLGGVAGHSTYISLAVAMIFHFNFLSLVHTIYMSSYLNCDLFLSDNFSVQLLLSRRQDVCSTPHS